MSAVLYALGRWSYRHARLVVALWLVVGVLLGALAFASQGRLKDTFDVPGSSSGEAMKRLHMTFPSGAKLTALALLVADEGTNLNELRTEIEPKLNILAIDLVGNVQSPWFEHISGQVSDDGRMALASITLNVYEVPEEGELQQLVEAGKRLEEELPDGIRVLLGGQAFALELPRISITEVIGVLLSFLVLWVMLGSLLTAVIPICTSLLGVGLAMALMYSAASIIDINSVTPMLALMLGTAVGLDYALFIYTRHRDQLRAGMELEESIARATGTAGTAVVFAGLTNAIALIGLVVANIPFLTVMGAFASVAVAFAVAIALTALPACAYFLGERMRPRPRKPSAKRERRFFHTWVSLSTRRPVFTIVAVMVILGVATLPATSLVLALPNAGQGAPTSPTRQSYDLIAKHLGPGYNAPLIVTAGIIRSNDPLGLINELKAEIEQIEGVERVALAVPNANADTALIQVVPETAPDDPATTATAERLRALTDGWAGSRGIEANVTGFTALQLDVTQRLAGAVVPFGVLVVGLTLVLLSAVFRSVWVPIKTAVGFLLSIGASFGLTQLVFNEGWAKDLIWLEKPEAVISFLPIIVIAILFGLAMDYEIFIVSRIREEYIHGRTASEAIRAGFVASGPVVTSVALVMVAVFGFFVPAGLMAIKQIAFALAVGVAIDAFLVRMTLVPAVLQLLGDHAWWMPAWLDRLLPEFDMEGEVLTRKLALADWPGTPALLHAEEVGVAGVLAPVTASLDPGEVAVCLGPPKARTAALLALSGRLRLAGGRARVAGHLLPDAARAVRSATVYLDLAERPGLATLNRLRPQPGEVWYLDGLDELSAEQRDEVAASVAAAADTGVSVLLGGSWEAAEPCNAGRTVVVAERGES